MVRSDDSQQPADTACSTQQSSENELRETFKVFDKDGDGFISAKDVTDTMKELGVVLTSDDVKAMMRRAGVGPQGKIYFRGMYAYAKGNTVVPLLVTPVKRGHPLCVTNFCCCYYECTSPSHQRPPL